jgi:hypothetical protein
LQCVDNSDKDGLDVISDLIVNTPQTTLSEQNDPKNALLSAHALLAERYYMRSTSTLPFFMFDCKEHESPLRIILGNQVNRRHLNSFKNSMGHYDFGTLVTPKRIKLLTRLALRDSKADTLIAVYRSHDRGEPQVIADLECKNHKHWSRLLMRHIYQPEFRVFKLVARLAHQPDKVRLEDALEPLTENEDALARKLLETSKKLSIVGALIDVTEQVSNWIRSSRNYNHSSDKDPIIYCDKEQPLTPPELLPIHYIQIKRSNDCFRVQIQVDISIAGQVHPGEVRVISPRELFIRLDKPYSCNLNERYATLTFPKLETQSSSMTRFQDVFRNVPAEIDDRAYSGAPLLQFRISDNAKGHLFSKKLAEFLAKWRSELRLDNTHILRSATSRLYSSIFIESSSTLPVFIFRNPKGDLICRFGKSSSPTPLIDFLEIADGKFDFSFLTDNDRLEHIIQQLSVSGSSELTMYLSKERHMDTASFDIRSVAEFEIDESETLNDFVLHAMDHDFRCVKVVVNHPDVPPKGEIEQAINRLTQLSPTKSNRLLAEFNNLIAIGDVVDITGLVDDSWTDEQLTRERSSID